MISIDHSERTKCTRQQSHPSQLAQDGEHGTFFSPLCGAGSTEGEPTPTTTFITFTCSAAAAAAMRQGSL